MQDDVEADRDDGDAGEGEEDMGEGMVRLGGCEAVAVEIIV